MKNTGLKFEIQVKSYLEKCLKQEFNKHIEVYHRKKYDLTNGEHVEIDLSYEFQIMDLNYLVLVECKDWKSDVDRDQVFTLAAKVNELNAHKGIVISGKGFQKGAIALAKDNKIGLLKVSDKGDVEIYSNFTGQDLEQLEKSLEPDTVGITSSFGLIEPKYHILEYLNKKFDSELASYLWQQLLLLYEHQLNGDKETPPDIELDGLSEEIIKALKGVHGNWYQEYELVEKCGLHLSLLNSSDLRILNMLILAASHDNNVPIKSYHESLEQEVMSEWSPSDISDQLEMLDLNFQNTKEVNVRVEIAKRMKLKGYTPDIIQELTKLSDIEISEL